MEERQGVFIALEGTDGSGKGTQFALLAEYLKAEGYEVETFDFPRYDSPSSYFVKEYLNGKYGGADEVGPYTSSLFYALDRYEAAPKIREALNQGKIVLSNRFTGSSMGHQGTKFQHAEERRGYFIWLDNLEFEMLRIPRPDTSLVLRVPAEIAQNLVDQKEQRSYTDKKRDIHEADLTHLQRAVAVYDDLCQLFPKDFQRIDCVRSGQLMPIEAIQEILRQKILPLLPPPGAGSPTITNEEPDQMIEYYTPENFDPATKAVYRSHMDELLELHATMTSELKAFLRSSSSQETAVSQILQPVLPVATLTNAKLPNNQTSPLKKLAAELLPANHNNESKPLQLATVWPRNEFDLIPDMLYSQSNVPLRTLKSRIADWPYDQKLKVFETYLAQSEPGQALNKAQYTWDILDTFAMLHALPAANVEAQELTPRYGFDVPILIEQAGLTDKFEQCFEISLKLHSLLQANGYVHEAQHTTLLGHKQRFTLSLSARELFALYAQGLNSELEDLLQLLAAKLSETHPIIAETLTGQDAQAER